VRKTSNALLEQMIQSASTNDKSCKLKGCLASTLKTPNYESQIKLINTDIESANYWINNELPTMIAMLIYTDHSRW